MNKFFCVTSLLFFLASCGVKKVTNTDFSKSLKKTTEIINSVNSNSTYSKWLSLKGRAKIAQKNQDITVNVNIINRKDSIIWASAKGPFGIEIIRAQITPDSVFLINRINKKYYIISALEARELLKVDFSFFDIQDVITANPKILKTNYTLKANREFFYLIADSVSYLVTNTYNIKNIKRINNKNTLEITLEDYLEEDNFPRKINLKVEAEESFEAIIEYSKVEFNRPRKFLFEIPNSYNEGN
tara:strand:- start:1724 stop:2452 length:729 start_codon:yes stop_codon:yes gene_type:complete